VTENVRSNHELVGNVSDLDVFLSRYKAPRCIKIIVVVEVVYFTYLDVTCF
jgi:hypothetical protein